MQLFWVQFLAPQMLLTILPAVICGCRARSKLEHHGMCQKYTNIQNKQKQKNLNENNRETACCPFFLSALLLKVSKKRLFLILTLTLWPTARARDTHP